MPVTQFLNTEITIKEEDLKFPNALSGKDCLYTSADGGANPNPGKGGYGVVLVTEDKLQLLSGGGSETSTNNAMEVMGLLRTMEHTLEGGYRKAVWCFDSTYVINGLTKWIFGWEHNDFLRDGKPIANAELWKKVNELRKKLKEAQVSFQLRWVKGHADNTMNHLADALATKGLGLEEGKEETLAIALKDLLTPKPEALAKETKEKPAKVERIHPLFMPRLAMFLTNVPSLNKGKYWYYGFTHNKQITAKDREKPVDFLGVELSCSYMIVCALDAPIKPMEDIRHLYEEKLFPDAIEPHVFEMNEITRKSNWEAISRFEKGAFTITPAGVKAKNKESMISRVKPPKRFFDAYDRAVILSDLIEDIATEKPSKAVYHDITDQIFELDGKKFKLKDSTDKDNLKITVPHKGEDKIITVTYGVETPRKAELQRLVKDYTGVKIHLAVFEESKRSFRYAMVIRFDGGAAACFAPFSSYLVY